MVAKNLFLDNVLARPVLLGLKPGEDNAEVEVAGIVLIFLLELPEVLGGSRTLFGRLQELRLFWQVVQLLVGYHGL